MKGCVILLCYLPADLHGFRLILMLMPGLPVTLDELQGGG